MRKILPFILASITNHPRQKVVAGVDFQWAPNSWSYNAFRVFELIFWARSGQVQRLAVSPDNKGNWFYKCYTLEDIFILAEMNIRGAFKWKLPKLVLVPVLAPTFASAHAPYGTQPYMFAIAFVATVGGPSGTSSGGTVSFTVSGSNSLVLADTYSFNGTTSTTGVTFNGNAFTFVNGGTEGYGGERAIWAIVGQSGTANVVTSVSVGVVTNSFGVVSYSGVNQSATPDSSALGLLAASPKTTSTIVILPNCWLTLYAWTDGAQAVASTGSTFRGGNAANDNQCAMFDSNGTVGTGSQSMTVTSTGNISTVIASWAPAAGGLVVLPLKTLLGVGI